MSSSPSMGAAGGQKAAQAELSEGEVWVTLPWAGDRGWMCCHPATRATTSALWADGGMLVKNHKNGDFRAEEDGRWTEKHGILAELFQVCSSAALWLQNPFIWWIRAVFSFMVFPDSQPSHLAPSSRRVCSLRTLTLFALIGVNEKSEFWMCRVCAALAEQDLAYTG